MTHEIAKQRWVVGVSGASGMRYALRLLDVLTRHNLEVHAIFSESALRVMHEEEHLKISSSSLSSHALLGREQENLFFHSPKDIGAGPASGSFRAAGMVVVPCSMSTLGALANGVASNLLHRAAEVTLKEGRPLIIVPRETPLSTIHLQNMLTLSQAGARIVPAMPGFYHCPTSIEEIVDMMTMKILDVMGIENDLVTRWK